MGLTYGVPEKMKPRVLTKAAFTELSARPVGLGEPPGGVGGEPLGGGAGEVEAALCWWGPGRHVPHGHELRGSGIRDAGRRLRRNQSSRSFLSYFCTYRKLG